MGCLACERKKRSSFYAKYVGLVGHESLSLLLSTAYFAKLSLTASSTRTTWSQDTSTLTLCSMTNKLSIAVRQGAPNVLLTYGGKSYQVTKPEDAAYIIQPDKRLSEKA